MNQAVKNRTVARTHLGHMKHPVLPANGLGAKGSLYVVGIDLEVWVLEVDLKFHLASNRVLAYHKGSCDTVPQLPLLQLPRNYF